MNAKMVDPDLEVYMIKEIEKRIDLLNKLKRQPLKNGGLKITSLADHLLK